MIKQIVEFSRPGDDGAAEIVLYVFTDEPEQTDKALLELMAMSPVSGLLRVARGPTDINSRA